MTQIVAIKSNLDGEVSAPETTNGLRFMGHAKRIRVKGKSGTVYTFERGVVVETVPSDERGLLSVAVFEVVGHELPSDEVAPPVRPTRKYTPRAPKVAPPVEAPAEEPEATQDSSIS